MQTRHFKCGVSRPFSAGAAPGLPRAASAGCAALLRRMLARDPAARCACRAQPRLQISMPLYLMIGHTVVIMTDIRTYSYAIYNSTTDHAADVIVPMGPFMLLM
jgi:hypothetical protein